MTRVDTNKHMSSSHILCNDHCRQVISAYILPRAGFKTAVQILDNECPEAVPVLPLIKHKFFNTVF